MSLRARWLACSRRERAGWIGVAALLLLAPVVRPLGEALSLELRLGAATAAFTLPGPAGPGETLAADPWGNPLVATSGAPVPVPGAVTFISRGPDGRLGTGDDVVLSADAVAAGLQLVHAPLNLVFLAVIVAWCLRGPWVHTPRSPTWWRELGRAAVVASVPTPLAFVVLAWAFRLGVVGIETTARAVYDRSPALVPIEVALYGTPPLIGLALAFAWRISRPLADPEDAARKPGQRSPRGRTDRRAREVRPPRSRHRSLLEGRI